MAGKLFSGLVQILGTLV